MPMFGHWTITSIYGHYCLDYNYKNVKWYAYVIKSLWPMVNHECLANFVLSVDISNNNNNNNNNNKVKLLYFKWIFSSSSLGIFYMKRRTCVLETFNTKKTTRDLIFIQKTPEI